MIHDTQIAQISQKQDERNMYISRIMRNMYKFIYRISYIHILYILYIYIYVHICRMIFISFSISTSSKRRSNCLEVFYKIGLLNNFTKFTGKHLRWNLFLNKVTFWMPATF